MVKQMIARRKPLEIFKANFKKAEVIAGILDLIATPGEIRDSIRSGFFDWADRVGESRPALGTLLKLIGHGADKTTEDVQERRILLERTIYELSIVPAITATEMYVKRVHEIYKEEEYDRTIGSIGDMQKALPSDKVEVHKLFPNDSERKKVQRGFGFRHAIIHNGGYLDGDACEQARIPKVEAGEPVWSYIEDEEIIEIQGAFKDLVLSIHKKLES